MTDVLQAPRESVGIQIKAARKAAHLTHDRLAELVGTSRQHLIKLEKGRHAPRPEMLTKIAEATGKPESFFVATSENLDPFATLGESIADALRFEVRALVQREMSEARGAAA